MYPCVLIIQHVAGSPPHEEPLHLELEGHEGWLESGVETLLSVVVSRDGSTDGHPAIHVHVDEDGLGDVPSNVVEVTVHSAWCCSPHCSLTIINKIK